MGPRVLVYALGAGAGHLARALAFARRLLPEGQRVTILHSSCRVPLDVGPQVELVDCAEARPSEVLGRVADALRAEPTELVVDTFPGGLWHELDPATLALASRRTLLRRFVRVEAYPRYHALAERFDDILVPYSEAASEWLDDRLPHEQAVGPLVRTVARHGRASVVVVGDASALPSEARRALPEGTLFRCGAFSSLPDARAYLALEAGYNLSYELAALGRPLGLVPRERRFDDQYRRADLLQCALHHGRQITRWLEDLS